MSGPAMQALEEHFESGQAHPKLGRTLRELLKSMAWAANKDSFTFSRGNGYLARQAGLSDTRQIEEDLKKLERLGYAERLVLHKRGRATVWLLIIPGYEEEMTRSTLRVNERQLGEAERAMTRSRTRNDPKSASELQEKQEIQVSAARTSASDAQESVRELFDFVVQDLEPFKRPSYGKNYEKPLRLLQARDTFDREKLRQEVARLNPDYAGSALLSLLEEVTASPEALQRLDNKRFLGCALCTDGAIEEEGTHKPCPECRPADYMQLVKQQAPRAYELIDSRPENLKEIFREGHRTAL